jgi:TatD DNase family protein
VIYCDIHTHRFPSHAEDIALVSRDIRESWTPVAGCHYALGIHPWFADRKMLPLLQTYAGHSQVAAIGETGLDRNANAPLSLQKEIFEAQAALACELRKPLIVHCVKAWSEVMNVRRRICPHVPCIIHGFRGNAQLAGQLLQNGFYLSFGSRFQQEAVLQAWNAHRLLAETDDKNINIREIYALLSSQLGVAEDTLSQQIVENVETVVPQLVLK